MAHLAIFLPDMRGGGAERVVLTLIQGFVERGHQVDLVVMNRSSDLMDLVPRRVRVIELNVPRIRKTIRPLAAYLKRHRPDGLMAVMWPMTSIAVMARQLAGVPTRLITSDHAILSEHYAGRPARMFALRLSTRLFYPRADARIAPSRAIAADIAELTGLDRDVFTIIPNPVAAPAKHSWSGEDRARLWGSAAIRILSVGALKPEKNHALLLRAFAHIAATNDARLVILGEGSLRPELQALAVELGIADRVSMPGFRADPRPWFATATQFLLSSNSEGFGNVLVEAMASGLPIVSTATQGARELLEDGKWGLLVPVGDHLALAEAIQQSIDESADGELLRSRAAFYASDRIVETYLRELTGRPAMSEAH